MPGMQAAFIGLGVMGYPMAGALGSRGLADAGTQPHRWPGAEVGWRSTAASGQARPRKRSAGADLAFVCVGNDDDVRGVCLTETGALSGMASGSVLVDHTTVSAEVARELAAAR